MGSLVLTGNTSGSVTVAVPAVAGTNTITLPAITGTAITTGDTGTITNTMISTSTSTGFGLCRAWCNYNAGTATVVQSFNVSSVTVNGTGDFTFNYTTALPNANNSVVAMGSGDGGAPAPNLYGSAGTNLTTSVRVYGWGTSTHFANCIAVFGA